MENQESYQEQDLVRINEEAFHDASLGYQPRYPEDEAYMQLYDLFKSMALM